MSSRIAAAVFACSIAPLCALSPVVRAAGSTHACARLQERTERLDCYDAAFGKPAVEGTTTPASVQAAPVTSQQSFGLTQQQIDRNSSEGGAAKLDSVTSVVVALKRGHDGQFTVTLENGQVWAQTEVDSRATLVVGDPVTIRHAAMGSFLLVTKRGIATRVKRLD
jgi:hypothetical protein